MNIVKKTRNVIRGMVQAYGTVAMKRRLWNSEFSAGRWKCLDSSPGDTVYTFVERYALGRSILDLGCGSGNTGVELDVDCYGRYIGVDISDVAIESAKQRSLEVRRDAQNRYVQSDIADYVPTDKHGVILLRDSIYYLPQNQIIPTLTRYAEYLMEAGVFIVRMYDSTGKYQMITTAIEEHFDVVERHTDDRSGVLVIVFRPKVRGASSWEG